MLLGPTDDCIKDPFEIGVRVFPSRLVLTAYEESELVQLRAPPAPPVLGVNVIYSLKLRTELVFDDRPPSG